MRSLEDVRMDLAGALARAEQAMAADGGRPEYHSVTNRLVDRLVTSARELLEAQPADQPGHNTTQMVRAYLTLTSLRAWQGNSTHFRLDDSGELLETADTREDGAPDWDCESPCDPRGGDMGVQDAIRFLLNYLAPKPKALSLDTIVAELHRRGVHARVERAGGNIALLHAGVGFYDYEAANDIYPVTLSGGYFPPGADGDTGGRAPADDLAITRFDGTDYIGKCATEADAANVMAHLVQGTPPLDVAGTIVPYPLLPGGVTVAEPPPADPHPIDQAITEMAAHIDAVMADLRGHKVPDSDEEFRGQMRGYLGGPFGEYAAATHPGFLMAVRDLLAFVKRYTNDLDDLELHGHGTRVAEQFLLAGKD